MFRAGKIKEKPSTASPEVTEPFTFLSTRIVTFQETAATTTANLISTSAAKSSPFKEPPSTTTETTTETKTNKLFDTTATISEVTEPPDNESNVTTEKNINPSTALSSKSAETTEKFSVVTNVPSTSTQVLSDSENSKSEFTSTTESPANITSSQVKASANLEKGEECDESC